MIEELRAAGLRTVPVYGTIRDGEIAEKRIRGNFLDTKEKFGPRQAVNLNATFFGLEGDNTEVPKLKPITQKMDERLSLGQWPSIAAMNTALEDFKAIQVFMTKSYISDLQGMVEFGTGRFYIIDPLGTGPIENANVLELENVQYVNQVIANLEMGIAVTLKMMAKHYEAMKLVPIPGPPGRPKVS